MTQKDVNQLFTDKVASLIAQGYQINTCTMSGTEGELARVDLRKGSEIIRILLDRRNDFQSYHSIYYDIYRIAVGRYAQQTRDDWQGILWNNRLEIVCEIALVKVSDTFFTGIDEAKAMSTKRIERWRKLATKPQALGEAYKSVALRYIRRQPRMKSCRLEEIESVIKGTTSDGRACYEITARGKKHTLCAKER